MSEKSAIRLKILVRSQRTLSQLFELLFPLPPVDFSEEKFAGGKDEESPVGAPEGPIEIGGVCQTEADTEAEVEDED